MRKRQDIKMGSTSGVTILEILVVLAIIALLASVVAPRVIGQLGKAKSQTAALQIDNLVSAVQLFYIDTGRYPSETEGLPALFAAPTGAEGWSGPYLDTEEALSDPWGRDYIYSGEGAAGFGIQSLGRDGTTGGAGEDIDLAS